MERAWNIAAVICLFIAAFFLWRENYNAAFVAATLGAVAWFMNYRSQLHATIPEPPETSDADEEDFEDDEEK
jgi:hypothetical protein